MRIWIFAIILFFRLPFAYSQIVIENPELRLTMDVHGYASSLIDKASGQECLAEGVKLPAFSVMQYRPYDNETMLTYVTRPTTFYADTISRKGDTLFVGFARLDYIAVISLKIERDYVGFRLERFVQKQKELGVKLETRIDETTFLQLPVRNRQHFGEWLNVCWDGTVAINLLGTDVHTRIDDIPEKGYHIMRAGSVREVQLTHVGAALIVAPSQRILDRVDAVERDFHLPRGVQSRRQKNYQYSYYECRHVTPKNIDEHIHYARMGGFKMMVIYYTDFAKSMGHFPWRKEYSKGMADLKYVTRKIKEAGMIPGLHVHYNKAQINDPYVTPVPDPRLNLRKMFTLSEAIDDTNTVIKVEESPRDITLQDGRRLLKIGKEIVEYAGYTTKRPYQFTGCIRGFLNTRPSGYEKGFKFGLLDVDNWPIFIRFDQRTSIQDEVADRIAKIVKEAGFRFIYFDGAEDVNRPFWFNVPLAQKRLYDKLEPKPLFSEGACKTHFSWHILSRGNAFDTFKPKEIKRAVNRWYLLAAKYNADNFTAVNFGWIGYTPPGKETIGLQPDMVEYIAAHAVGWDSPWSLIGELAKLKSHPRTPDNLEISKRWENARLAGFFTKEQKEQLRKANKEFILLINEKGKYELHSCRQVKNLAGHNPHIRAFLFQRNKKSWVVYWHTCGEAGLKIPVQGSHITLFKRPGVKLKISKVKDGIVLPVGCRRFIASDLPEEKLEKLLSQATVIEDWIK